MEVAAMREAQRCMKQQQREHIIAIEEASVLRGFQTDWDVSIWEKSVTYLSVTE